MFEIALAVVPVALLLILSEILWRAHLLRGEPARKLLHIIIGSYVAYWLYFLTFHEIQLLSLAMLIGVTISHKYHIFHAITDVKRKTWGDIFYAVGLGLIAVLAKQPWAFAIAVLHMSVADGLAGLIGTEFGKGNRYKVLGATKSVVGTLCFVVVSFALFAVFNHYHPSAIIWPVMLAMPPFLALIENLGVYGTDNILIPLLVVIIANALI
jgi:phytol kinase